VRAKLKEIVANLNSPQQCRTGRSGTRASSRTYCTSSLWLNLVGRFFALITEDAVRRGVFNSVAQLEATIADYLTNHNAKPTPAIPLKWGVVSLIGPSPKQGHPTSCPQLAKAALEVAE
jgi:hypothetical protein